jgi:serine/threonine protein kinase/Tfp pilus assembly protein PilF
MTSDSDRPTNDRDHADEEPTRLPGPRGTAGGNDATRHACAGPRERVSAPGREEEPDRIGGYRVLGRLGTGGMGVVYEAEQQDPRRTVALKVIRGGAFVDDEQVRMFQREVETLARLSHPNIGAIYESGRTADGQPYFAMELVRGATLDVYLARRPAPSTPGELEHRLRLFATIASAVHYAHQRGVIHRDLKPSNIVIAEATPSGDSTAASAAAQPPLPQVKILDFGLARVTDEDVVNASLMTEIGVIKGTLPYMSPEQARGDAAAIDVRTDVYALGILLYEMVCGRKPYDVDRAALLEAVRVICQEPPRPLGAQWSGRRPLDQDVETITGKALAKEPDRRYESAAALADDVYRFLGSQPILARPPSAVYQLRKFAQRHRPMVVGASLAVAALAVGTVLSTTLYVRAEREAERARLEAATAEQVNGFLRAMLEGVGPSVAQGRDTTLLEDILQRANERIEEELVEEPVLEATIRSTLGAVYYEIADFANTETQLTRALELFRAQYGEEHEDVAQSYFNLGLFEQKRDDPEEAERLLRRAIELARLVHGDQHEKTASYTTHLGNALVDQGRYDEALPYLAAALESLRAVHGNEHVDVGIALNSLGNAHHYLGGFDEARPLYEEALAIHRTTLGDRHPYVATDLANLAYLAKNEGDLATAETRFRAVLTLHEELHPDGDPGTLQIIGGLATVLQHAGRYDESETLRLEGLAMARALYGESSESVARQLLGLGNFYDATGQARSAREIFDEATQMILESAGTGHPLYASALNSLGMARTGLGEHGGAIEVLTRAVELCEQLYGAEAPDTTLARMNLARAHRSARDYPRAEQLFRQVIDTSLRTRGREYYGTGTAMIGLARVLIRTGAVEEAIQFARDGADIFEATLGADHFQAVRTRMIHAEILREAGRPQDSERLLRPLHARQIELGGEQSDRSLRVGAVLGRVLADLGHGDAVEALYAAALSAAEGTFQESELVGLRESYGRALHQLGRFEEARDVLEAVYESYTRTSGPRSPDALDAAEALAALHASWGEHAPGAGHETRARGWRERARPNAG